MHPQIGEIVEGLVARKKYIYLCTNALLLKEKIGLFKPSKYLTFSVHLDGQREHHQATGPDLDAASPRVSLRGAPPDHSSFPSS